MEIGNLLALIGAAIAVAVTGAGSSLGMAIVQRAAAGLVAEQPEKYNRTLVFQLLTTTGALYGFVVGFLVLQKAVLGGGSGYGLWQGAMILAACLPVAIVGMAATIAQARVCASVIMMIAKRSELDGRAVTMAIFAEFFALLGLIVSILCVFAIPTL